MEYNLPRGYLSWSAYNSWKRSKNSYRKKYYENLPDFKTHETIFGKKIADALERGEKLPGLVEYGTSEFPIEVELIPGLKLLGRLDGLNEETKTITEFKTGHLSKGGAVPWNAVKVRKHGQLVFYSLMVKLFLGEVDPNVTLQWFETEFKRNKVEFDGHTLEGISKELRLTGRVETFERIIAPWELEKMKEDIINVATEISEDYTEWLKK